MLASQRSDIRMGAPLAFLFFVTVVQSGSATVESTCKCGWLDEPVRCSGYPDHNNATCTCPPILPGQSMRTCVGAGWHDTVNQPISFQCDEAGPEIGVQEEPCGWRWKCSITESGPDGQAPCITTPGCRFRHDTTKVYSFDIFPYLFAMGSCPE